MYDNLMNKFKYGGLDQEGLYLDETVMRMCYTHRRLFSQLGSQLLREGKKEQALRLMEKAEKAIPASVVPHGWQGGSLDIARTWLSLEKNQKCEEIAAHVAQNACEYLDWYISLPSRYTKLSTYDIRANFITLQDAVELLEGANSKLAPAYDKRLRHYYDLVSGVLYEH